MRSCPRVVWAWYVSTRVRSGALLLLWAGLRVLLLCARTPAAAAARLLLWDRLVSAHLLLLPGNCWQLLHRHRAESPWGDHSCKWDLPRERHHSRVGSRHVLRTVPRVEHSAAHPRVHLHGDTHLRGSVVAACCCGV